MKIKLKKNILKNNNFYTIKFIINKNIFFLKIIF